MRSRRLSAHWLRCLAASLCLLGFLCSGNNLVPGVVVLLAAADGDHTVHVSRGDNNSVSIVLAHDRAHHHNGFEARAVYDVTPIPGDLDAGPGDVEHVLQFVGANQYAGALLSQLQRTTVADAGALLATTVAPLASWPNASQAQAARPPPLPSTALLSRRTIVLVI